MKTKTAYYLHNYKESEITEPMESTKDVCQLISDLSLDAGDYIVTEQVSTVEAMDFTTIYNAWKSKRKSKDVDGELVQEKGVIIIKGEVKG